MKAIIWLVLCVCCIGCTESHKTLKVAATAVPHAEMLEQIKPDLKEKGIELEIVEVDDYQLPNRLLAETQVDANFFQHLPFLRAVEKEYGNRLEVLVQVHYEPLGIYSKKIKTLSELKAGSTVAIPYDPSNETRALLLLSSLNLIELNNADSPCITVRDILKNPLLLKFTEIDAPLLPRILPDVTIAVIPSNFALQAHLEPNFDALAIEKSTEYPNVVVIRKGDEKRADLQALKLALTSEKMRLFLCEKYKGAVQPLF